MMYKNILLFFTVFLFQLNSVSSQSHNKTLKVPFVKCTNEELNLIVDTLFNSEKKCEYYNDTLLMGITIIVNPEDKSMYSIQFASETRKEIMFLESIPVLAYFQYQNHFCFIYNYLPEDLFALTNSVKCFSYKKSKEPDMQFFEDDSFSQWKYYFKDGRFYLDEYYSYCEK